MVWIHAGAQKEKKTELRGKSRLEELFIHDLGRAIMHKRIIIRLYLEGYLTPEIARRTKHSEEACDRYIRAFNKVRMLADRNMSVEEIARTLEMSSFTVKEYLNIYSEFKGGDSNAK